MAQRKVIWTKTAEIQFVGILEYWVKHNESNTYSKKLLGIVAERTEQIAKYPLMHKATNFKDVRVASLGNFSIFYKVTDDSIIISSFWDNRQDPTKLLDILKSKK
jgi:plasmid stabilization system protein ParE